MRGKEVEQARFKYLNKLSSRGAYITRELKDLMPVRFDESKGAVVWLEQTLLPPDKAEGRDETWLTSTKTADFIRALKRLEVRGAPTIGVFAAYAVASLTFNVPNGESDPIAYIQREAERIANARPTAVNLRWAVNKMLSTLEELGPTPSLEDVRKAFLTEAKTIEKNEYEAGKRIGEFGNSLIEDGTTIFTRCNAGQVACGGFGTAGGVWRTSWAASKDISVVAATTLPLMQGARITMWELERDGIPSTLIGDNAVAWKLANTPGKKAFVVGADRILLNGEVANKIGTFQDAILAQFFGVPFYVAAPLSTIDPVSTSIPIEMRDPEEVKNLLGKLRITTRTARAENPAFDVTPRDLISGIITEKGIARAPYSESLSALKGANPRSARRVV